MIEVHLILVGGDRFLFLSNASFVNAGHTALGRIEFILVVSWLNSIVLWLFGCHETFQTSGALDHHSFTFFELESSRQKYRTFAMACMHVGLSVDVLFSFELADVEVDGRLRLRREGERRAATGIGVVAVDRVHPDAALLRELQAGVPGVGETGPRVDGADPCAWRRRN